MIEGMCVKHYAFSRYGENSPRSHGEQGEETGPPVVLPSDPSLETSLALPLHTQRQRELESISNQLEVFMTRVRQIAVASFGSIALAIGLAGCAGNRPETIGANAVMETSGDKTLTWTASSSGNLTVYDQSSDKIAYGATVAAGQSVKVDVDSNRIMLDSQIVSENSLHGGDGTAAFDGPDTFLDRIDFRSQGRLITGFRRDTA